jgi:endonuclease/exonuclease/phosphatase family metal-dependent hydrolase
MRILNRYSFLKILTTILRMLVLFVLTISLTYCSSNKEEDQDYIVFVPELKVCSFNIRFDNPADGFNNWENRRKAVVSFLAVESLDIFGLQEVLKNQLDYIEKSLPDYTRIGVGRDDGISAGEYAPVFFNSERFELRDSGTFWLSETPDVPSIGWNAALNRVCTYVILTDKVSGEEVHFYNTHYSHVSSTARLNSTGLILSRIDEWSENKRVILVGDLNVEPDNEVYSSIMSDGFDDSFLSNLKLGPLGTFNGFRLTGFFSRRIDYIFSKGLHAEKYVCNSIVVDNQYLSDHFPVISNLEYRPI